MLAAVAALSGSAAAVAGEPPWIHATPEDRRLPLPSSSVQTVLQDSTGFVWLGFYSAGVARYDGQQLELYGTDDGLPDLTVRELLEDGSGRLWVASETGLAVSEKPLVELAGHERVRFRSHHGGEPLLRGRIRHNWLTRAPDGAVLVATPGEELRRYRFRPDGSLDRSAVPLPPPATGGHTAVSAVLARRDGSVWVARENGWIGVRPPGGDDFRPLEPGRSPTPAVTAFAEGPTGTVWAGTRAGGVWRLEGVSGASPRFERLGPVLGEQVEAILELTDGAVWVASLGAGLLRLDATGTSRFTTADGLLSDTVWEVALDREGTLWFPTNGGFSRLRADYRAFEAFTGRPRVGALPPLPEPSAFAVLAGAPDEDVLLWAGTGGGLVALSQGDRRTVLDAENGLASRSVYALARDRAGRIWVGTSAGLDVLARPPAAVARAPGGAVRPVELAGATYSMVELPLDSVYAVDEVELPRLLPSHGPSWGVCVAGTRGVSLLAGDRWFLLGPRAGAPGSGATACAMDRSGTLWVGSSDTGLLRSTRPLPAAELAALPGIDCDAGREIVTPVLAPVYNRALGGDTDTVLDLVPAGSDLWVGTPAGLLRFDPGAARPDLVLDADSGLGGGQAVAVELDPVGGSLWVAQNEGLAEVDPAAGRVLRTVSRDDGLVDNEAWGPSAVDVGTDGRVYLATPKGVSVYTPWLDAVNRVPPPVRLREVSFEQGLAGHNELDVRYAGLTFTGSGGVRFRTRLAGWDDEWSPPTTDTRFRFTNLPAYLLPATYRFEVLASNGEGVWSTAPASFELKVDPPWWLRWWAVLLAALLLAAAAFGVDTLRTHRLVVRTRELEEQVAERTEQIRASARDLETLDRIVEAINRQVELEHVMEALLRNGLQLVPGARRGAFLVRDPEGNRFAVAAVSGWEADLPPGGTVDAREAQARFTAGARELADGVFLASRIKDRSGTTILEHLQASETLLTLNLTVEERIQGFLVFELDPASGVSPADLRRLQRYRQHAITALAKARIVHELEHRSREAADASRAKTAFLATMSHELRTPLNSIIGFSEVALSRLGDDDPKVRRFVSNILTSGRQLLSMINDILDLSKIEAGRMELEPEDADLLEIVEGVHRIMVGIAGSRGIEILCSVSPEIPPMRADAPKVKHILFNLLSNAVKFSPDGARVRLAAELVPASSSPLGRDTVRIEVADRGIGIPPAEQERIFEAFHQIESGASRRFAGSGLGLALVRRYAQLHGGTVAVASTEGEGSSFVVLLPVAADAPAPSA